MTNLTDLKGGWNETKRKMKLKFALLTDNDLMLLEGRRDDLIGRLQAKLGKTKEEILDIISKL
jgi:uncharacterized protein YjbJ (UPF0337 family)